MCSTPSWSSSAASPPAPSADKVPTPRLRQAKMAAVAGVMSACLISMLLGCREREEAFYSTLKDAAVAGQITRAWIPDFLPMSSRSIHIIYAPESPRTWCAFEFAPEDSKRLGESLTPVGAFPTPAKRIDNPGVPWWPNFLSGTLSEARIHNAGYSLYGTLEPDVRDSKDLVLFAVDWKNGRGFFYRVPVP
jgi:hypothetical protein